MLEILETRFNRLRQLERLGQLRVSDSLHRGFAQARLWTGDTVNRLVAWKLTSAEAALYEVLIFVGAMDPSYTPREGAEPDSFALRWHLADHDYWEVAFDTDQFNQISDEDRREILLVVDALKQRLRSVARGMRDELLASPSFGETLRRHLDQALAFGARNVGR